MNTEHPWQSGPTELIRYAIEHLSRENDLDQRIAFLLLDVGIETLFKTFLQLPEEVTGTKVSFSERISAAEGNFHELIRGVKKAAENRLDSIDMTHIQFYHDLRNKLYHQGNGVTVPVEKAKGYASITVECLRRLLDVDLRSLLNVQEEAQQRKATRQLEFDAFEQARKKLRTQVDDLRQVLLIALEGVEPTLVLPSFEQQIMKWKEYAGARLMSWSARLAWDDVARNASLESVQDLVVKPEQYASFLAEIQPTIPRALGDFISKYRVRPDVIVSIIRRDYFEEVLLILADIALKLPTDPSDNSYWIAEFISRSQPIEAVIPILNEPSEDGADPIPELVKAAAEASGKIKEIRDALLARTLG